MPRTPRTAEVNQLLKDITADVKLLRAKSAPSTGPLQTIAGDDLYEAYLFMRVLSAARRSGATLTLCSEQHLQGRPRMHPTQEIIFRRSPGTLHHASGPASDYTFALLTWPGRVPLALFVGIQAQGYSGVTHECDLLLLRLPVAQSAQSQPNYSLWQCAELYIEAKFNSIRVPLATARALIGVHADLWFDAVVLACHDDLATNAASYLSAGLWGPTAAGFGRVQPASSGHNLLEAHLATLF
ncbi:hypothetical protein [Micrococcus lylae]|uniref:hypothetical protein n=1 Tax=Micrococcus lylae TaxID=1273 RepID=UPI000C8088AD|nr:hypothetical protein [Micrococcus lylae]WIK82448.1 hypothetical protein CJ228_001050 [Micrococcus lylae]